MKNKILAFVLALILITPAIVAFANYTSTKNQPANAKNTNRITITDLSGVPHIMERKADGDEADEAVVAVEDDHIADVIFTNSAVFTGDVEIGKAVVSDYAPHLTDAYEFDFTVTIENADPEEEYLVDLVQAGVGITFLPEECSNPRPGIRFVPLENWHQALYLCILYDKWLEPPVWDFAELVVRKFRGLSGTR